MLIPGHDSEEVEIGPHKDLCLDQLDRYKKDGELDEGIEDYLHTLNTIPGVATHYSCMGHTDGHVDANELDCSHPYVITFLSRKKVLFLFDHLEGVIGDAGFRLHVDFVYQPPDRKVGDAPNPMAVPMEGSCLLSRVSFHGFEVNGDRFFSYLIKVLESIP